MREHDHTGRSRWLAREALLGLSAALGLAFLARPRVRAAQGTNAAAAAPSSTALPTIP